MSTTTFHISDMHCAACTNKIRNALAEFANIQYLNFNPIRKQVFVTHTNAVTPADLLLLIERAGFHPQLQSDTTVYSAQDKQLLKRLGIAGLATMQVMMVQIALYAGAFQGIDVDIQRVLELTALLFCLPVISYSAIPFFSSALRSIRHGLNMDAPIALAISIAFSASFIHTVYPQTATGEVYYDSVVMFTFLMLLARFIDQRLRNRLKVEDSLLATLPRQVSILCGEQRKLVRLEDIQAGDTLWITEGEQLAVDGTLLDDRATLDEALLSGETDWRVRKQGELLYAGTFNRGAGLKLVVTKTRDLTRLAEIDQLSMNALEAKHKFSRLADSVARIFIPIILAIAATTYFGWLWVAPNGALSAALAVLVVSCPCALSLATPAALTAALARLRQAGILVKNTRALEIGDDVIDIYFDKTGTLTTATPQLQRTEVLGKFDEATCISIATALQTHSSHPLARAFHQYASTGAKQVHIVPGKGIHGMVGGSRASIGTAAFTGMSSCQTGNEHNNKSVFLSINDMPAAVFELENPLRADASPTLFTLRDDGKHLHILSGDNAEACQKLAAKLDIDFHANASPESKPITLTANRTNLGKVMYVGDGMNDLPALAQADVSVATLETSDLVKSKADIILLTTKLSSLIDFFRLSRVARRVIWQNLSWALAYNVFAIPLAAFGYAPPWVAALGMSASSLIVLLNAARILRTPVNIPIRASH